MQRNLVLKEKLFCTMKKCMVSVATVNMILEHGDVHTGCKVGQISSRGTTSDQIVVNFNS